MTELRNYIFQIIFFVVTLFVVGNLLLPNAFSVTTDIVACDGFSGETIQDNSDNTEELCNLQSGLVAELPRVASRIINTVFHQKYSTTLLSVWQPPRFM